MKYILTIFIFLFICIGLSAQKPKVMTAADSAAAQQAEANKFVDSLLTKTSLKEFQTFLYESVSGKEYNEGTFIRLYDLFLRTKYNEWMQRKQQKKN